LNTVFVTVNIYNTIGRGLSKCGTRANNGTPSVVYKYSALIKIEKQTYENFKFKSNLIYINVPIRNIAGNF